MSHSLVEKILIVTTPLARVAGGIESYDYFAGLVSQLTIKLQAKFRAADIVIKIPDGSQTSPAQVAIIDEAIKSGGYNIIIVSPCNVYDIYSSIFDDKWKKAIENDRIFFIDQGFKYLAINNALDVAQQDADIPPYVQSDWEAGGKIAAESLLQYFLDTGITCPHIVCVSGGVGSEERIKGFKEIMKEGSNFYPTFHEFDARYHRSTAKNIFSTYLNSCLQSYRPIDAIFACNDEMALGVREALLDKYDEYTKCIAQHRNNILPKIVGFDGIKDLTFLIHDGDKELFIWDTIVVELEKQIDSLVKMIEKRFVTTNKKLSAKEKHLSQPCVSYRQTRISNTH